MAPIAALFSVYYSLERYLSLRAAWDSIGLIEFNSDAFNDKYLPPKSTIYLRRHSGYGGCDAKHAAVNS